MIISNSTPLILHAKINRIDILKRLFKRVVIPSGVYNEVVTKGKKDRYADAFLIEKYIDEFIFVKKIEKRFQSGLERLKQVYGSGESEAIILAIQEKAPLLMDDFEARRYAEEKGIKVRGTLGILLKALKKELISLEEYGKSIRELAKHAWLSGEIVAEFLQAGYKLKGGSK